MIALAICATLAPRSLHRRRGRLAATTTTTAVPADVEVTGPITGGVRDVVYVPMPPGIDEEYGYVEEEYFITGEAASYVPTAPLTEDGMWTLSEGPGGPVRLPCGGAPAHRPG